MKLHVVHGSAYDSHRVLAAFTSLGRAEAIASLCDESALESYRREFLEMAASHKEGFWRKSCIEMAKNAEDRRGYSVWSHYVTTVEVRD